MTAERLSEILDKDAKIAWLRAEHLRLRRENDALTAQLARCREETVRECAKVCEQLDGDNAKFGYNRAYNLCARAIRALAPTTGDGR